MRRLVFVAATILVVYTLARTSSIACAQGPFQGFTLPQGWTLDQDYDGMRTWTGDASVKQFLSIAEDASMKDMIPSMDDKTFIENIKTSSAAMNWLAGIREWKVEKLERATVPGGYRIALIGSYLNSKKERIRFEEWKYFLHSGFAQIDYSELAGTKPFDRNRAGEILRRYQPFGT